MCERNDVNLLYKKTDKSILKKIMCEKKWCKSTFFKNRREYIKKDYVYEKKWCKSILQKKPTRVY